jgi:DNA polymerase IV
MAGGFHADRPVLMSTPSSPPRSILLSDCDVFYVQVARMADPEGAGKATLLIVGGSADSRGVVCSASYEVREFGVRSGMPIATAARLCPQAMCVPVPRGLCSVKSREIVKVLERFAPSVESASPDEAYLDLTSAMQTIYRGRPLAEMARDIRAAVYDETAIRVSMGGGTTKLVAKMAVERAKPRPGTSATGVHIVAPGDEAAFLSSFMLADIPGVGPRFQDRLAKIGWRRVSDVLPNSIETLARVLGEREGEWLYNVARGIDNSVVESRDEAKSMSRETTFAADTASDHDLRETLLALVDRVVSDLRGDGAAARTVTVKVKDADFRIRQASRTLPAPVSTYQAVAPVAAELLQRLRQSRRVAARLVGVTLSSLGDSSGEPQLALFEPEVRVGVETERQRKVAEAVDRARARLGRESIGFGSAGLAEESLGE